MITLDKVIPEIVHSDMEEMHRQVLADPNLKNMMNEMVNWLQNEYQGLNNGT